MGIGGLRVWTRVGLWAAVLVWAGIASAGPPIMAKDLAPGSESSNPEYLVDLDGVLLFVATSPDHGTELWRCDAPGGVSLVHDIRPGMNSSSPTEVTVAGGLAFFGAVTSGTNRELWKSDGTSAGTMLVREIDPTSVGSYPRRFAAVGSTVFFGADNGSVGEELWKSDGTFAGTVLVRDINGGLFTADRSSVPIDMVGLQGKLYFSASEYAYGREPWISDGTTEGTVRLRDIHTGDVGISDSAPRGFTLLPVGGVDTVLFVATDLVCGRELWRTRGTTESTERVCDIYPGSTSSVPDGLARVGNRVYFRANDGVHGVELWASTGENDGTVLVCDIRPGAVGSYPTEVTDVAGRAFFAADDGVHGAELWMSDGTAEGTVLVRDIAPGPQSSRPEALCAAGAFLLFRADDGENGSQVWVSDGTAEGTAMLGKIGDLGAAPGPYRLAGTRAYFAATHSSLGRELWYVDTSDLAPPRVSAILCADTSPTGADQVRFQVIFTEPVTGVDASDFEVRPHGLLGSAIEEVTGSGASYTVTVHTGTGEGLLALEVADDDSIRDDAGLCLGGWGVGSGDFDEGEAYGVDRAGPDVRIDEPSTVATATDPVTYRVTYSGASVVTLAAADVTLIRDGTATGTVRIEGSGTAERTVVIENISGNGTLRISLAPGTARDAFGNLAPAAGPSVPFTVDSVPPTLTVSAPSLGVTNTGPVDFTLRYTDAASVSLAASDVALVRTGTADGTVSVSGSDDTWVVRIADITGDGRLGISLPAGTAHDAAGNPAPALDVSETFEVDNTPPTATLVGPSANLTTKGPVAYTVTYAGADDIRLSADDVALVRTETADGTIAVMGDGSIRTVSVKSITGDGTLAIAVAAGSAVDAAGNAAPTLGPSAAFVVDNTRPTVTVGAPSAELTRNGPVEFPVIIEGATRVELGAEDVVIHRSGTAAATATVSGSGLEGRVVTLSDITGDGTLTVSVRSGAARDDAGNTNPTSPISAPVTVDNTGPKAVIELLDSSPTLLSRVRFVVTFNESVGDSFTAADITLTGTAAAGASVTVEGTGAEYTVTVDLGDAKPGATLGLSIGTDICDAAGNACPGAQSGAEYRVGSDTLEVALGPPSATYVRNGSVSIPVIYLNAAQVTLTADDVRLGVTGTAKARVEVSGDGVDLRTVTLADISGNGSLRIYLEAGTAVDAAGHEASGTDWSARVFVDNVPPVIALQGPAVVGVRAGDAFVDPGARATDSLDGDITSRIVVTGAPDTTRPGDYIVWYKVADRAGNMASTSRLVRVFDDGGEALPLAAGPLAVALLGAGLFCLRLVRHP